jgi:hypothetical protein
MDRTYDNCGNTQSLVIFNVIRYRNDSGDPVSHPERWCLECVQGKNPVRASFQKS